MIRLQKILVPIDFSENSKKAVRYGVAFAKDRKAQLTFLHVINQRIIDAVQEMSIRGYKGDFVEALKKLIKDREDEMLQFVPEAWRQDLEVDFQIRKGRPADEINNFAKENGIDMIIMGTSGRSAIATAFLGSVARSVVNHAVCPVLVVRPIGHDFIE